MRQRIKAVRPSSCKEMSWQLRCSSSQTPPWTSWRTPRSIPLRNSGVGPVLSSVWPWGSTNEICKVLDAKTKANQFFYFSNQLSYLRRSAISLICDPILYSFILLCCPYLSLSGMVPDQENFTAQSLLSKFAFDIPKSHPWPHWMEDRQGRECVTWHRWQEETVCHSLILPMCRVELRGSWITWLLYSNPDTISSPEVRLLCQLIEKC